MTLSDVCDKIRGILNVARKPLAPLPSLIAYCSYVQRPGLSVLVSAGNIIKAQANFGAPTGTLPDGTPNLMNQYTIETVKEIFRALKEDGVVDLYSGPGGLRVEMNGTTGISTNSEILKIGRGGIR